MPRTVPLAAIRLHDARLLVDVDDYTLAVGQVTFTPDATWDTDRRYDGGHRPSLTAVAWVVDLEHAQDVTTTDSLTRYLLAYAGQAREVRFEPVNGGRGVTATVVLIPSPIGGAPGEVLASAVSLPVVGAPVIDP